MPRLIDELIKVNVHAQIAGFQHKKHEQYQERKPVAVVFTQGLRKFRADFRDFRQKVVDIWRVLFRLLGNPCEPLNERLGKWWAIDQRYVPAFRAVNSVAYRRMPAASGAVGANILDSDVAHVLEGDGLHFELVVTTTASSG